ncbi:delta 1-pyrroline-5-carboxylate reductase [Recurvomyces mirabilis]|uniref:Delta 1-pyrroline-5-carboxylate reductase n=1 Tax=Recurvomyces mirabilis TaxID=574656 RepID=A0AAE1C300_9PEZI|nr:delta 1-pyrroline-5-carboxylate reductase [Recurvomyces mirabilis]KAK5153931.1 delta 1-pyrroline-5-carboxylate reductase [Recurvomyces mirabilis]
MSERILTPDYILQQALAAHGTALSSYLQDKDVPGSAAISQQNGDSCLTIVGCGTIGTAILGGILKSLDVASNFGNQENIETVASKSASRRLPKRFNACVRSSGSTKRIREALEHYSSFSTVAIHDSKTLEAVKDADTTLLCCKPYLLEEILQEPGMAEALAGKLLISVCAGVTEEHIATLLPRGNGSPYCTIVCAMPNTAAAIGESMTVISIPSTILAENEKAIVDWIFNSIGRVSYIPPQLMDVSTALCASGPAFVAVMVESLAAGAMAQGLPRDQAYMMAAQMMRGTTGLLLHGEHPAVLRDKATDIFITISMAYVDAVRFGSVVGE